jgi:hypothetical protein
MKQIFLRAGAMAAVAGLSACDGGDCAGVGRPAFEVTVLDARSDTPIAAGATVYLFRHPELARVDSVTGRYDAERIWTYDATGRFDVLVEKPGYFPWTRENVRVEGECTTETVFLTVRLRRRDA